MLQGYKTIIFNLVTGLLSLIITKSGMDIDPQTQTEIVTSIFTLGNIVLRFRTKGPIGTKSS